MDPSIMDGWMGGWMDGWMHPANYNSTAKFKIVSQIIQLFFPPFSVSTSPPIFNLGLGFVQLLFIFQTVNGGYYLFFIFYLKKKNIINRFQFGRKGLKRKRFGLFIFNLLNQIDINLYIITKDNWSIFDSFLNYYSMSIWSKRFKTNLIPLLMSSFFRGGEEEEEEDIQLS